MAARASVSAVDVCFFPATNASTTSSAARCAATFLLPARSISSMSARKTNDISAIRRRLVRGFATTGSYDARKRLRAGSL